MQYGPDGNRYYSSADEAVQFIRDNTKALVRWLHLCREQGARLPAFPQYRSLVNDIANITARWIEEREGVVSALRHELNRPCPACGHIRDRKE